MPFLLLTEDEVRQVLTMEVALQAVEDGLRRLALDEAVNVPRSRAQTDHAMLHVLSAAAKTLGYIGFKAYVTSQKGADFHVALIQHGRSTCLPSQLKCPECPVRRFCEFARLARSGPS